MRCGSTCNTVKTILPALCEQLCVEIVASEVMPDHVHLLISIPPPVPLGDVIRRLKGASSRNLRRQFPMLRRMPSLWTNSTFVATVGGAPLSVVQQYVRNQKVEG